MNQGGVHESFNMVGLYKLPVLYILENNQFAMGTSVERSTGQPDFVLKAQSARHRRAKKWTAWTLWSVRDAARTRLRNTYAKRAKPIFLN